jgi:hypothetical protein
MPCVGLIVEGDFDTEGLTPLVKRLNANNVEIVARVCNGPLSRTFVRRLQELRYSHDRLDRALVVCDAHGRDHTVHRRKLIQQAANLVLPFPVEYVVLVEELESVLLCDPRAIESVCTIRGRPIELPNLTTSPEDLNDPKSELVKQLRGGGVTYTKAVARAIAEQSNLQSLDYWSASFRRLRVAARLTP